MHDSLYLVLRLSLMALNLSSASHCAWFTSRIASTRFRLLSPMLQAISTDLAHATFLTRSEYLQRIGQFGNRSVVDGKAGDGLSRQEGSGRGPGRLPFPGSVGLQDPEVSRTYEPLKTDTGAPRPDLLATGPADAPTHTCTHTHTHTHTHKHTHR